MEDSGWRFDEINSLTIYLYKTGEMNGSSHVKIPLRSSAILKFQNDVRYCFLWSLLAHFLPKGDSKDGRSTRVSNYRQYFK